MDYAIYLVGLALFFLFSGSKYDWMTDVDPSVSSKLIQEGSDNRLIVVSIVLFVMLFTQFLLLLIAKKKFEKIISAVLMIFAVLAFCFSRGWIVL
jgi:hypothetical protein